MQYDSTAHRIQPTAGYIRESFTIYPITAQQKSKKTQHQKCNEIKAATAKPQFQEVKSEG